MNRALESANRVPWGGCTRDTRRIVGDGHEHFRFTRKDSSWWVGATDCLRDSLKLVVELSAAGVLSRTSSGSVVVGKVLWGRTLLGGFFRKKILESRDNSQNSSSKRSQSESPKPEVLNRQPYKHLHPKTPINLQSKGPSRDLNS